MFTVIAALVVVQDLTRVHLTAAYALLVAVYTIGTHGRDRFRAASAVLVESVVVVASIQLRPLSGSLIGSLVFLNSIVAAGRARPAGTSQHALLPARVEGLTRAQWVLMDYLDVVVHVFTPETREYYRLEQLWGEAPAQAVGVGVAR